MKSLILIALLAATPLAAHDFATEHLRIDHPYIPDPLPTAQSAAGYMTIANDSDQPERLLEVRTPFAKVSTLHETIVSDDGIARMQPVVDLIIPPNEEIILTQGGLHVMFMGLTSKVEEGDLIPATLIFQNAGEVAVEFMIDPTDGVDHSKMKHN